MDLGRVSILESQNVFKDTILFNINKVKVSLQAKGGGTVSFLITVPDGIQGQCHAMPASPMGYNRSTCCSGGWVGPTAGLDGWEKRKSLAPSGVQSLNCPVCNVFTPTMLSWPLIYHSCCWSILWHKQKKVNIPQSTFVGTPTCHHISFPYSVLHFTSQLSFLCLHTNP